MNEFIIAGVGGQGIITCSKMILQAAINKGYEVRSSETIGMSQRGGSVFSHVRIGRTVYSPTILAGKANEIIAMNPIEGFRYQKYLKSQGIIEFPVNNVRENIINTRTDIEIKGYNLKPIWRKLGTKQYTNIIMLGIVFGNEEKYIISLKDIECVIKTQFCGEIVDKNLEALYMGSNFMKGEF